MLAHKKQRLLTAYVDLDSSEVVEDTKSLASLSYSSNTNKEVESDTGHCRVRQKFLPCWKFLFPWVEIEVIDENEEKLYCRELV